MTATNPSRLFVYGTLRKDFEHEMYHILARWAVFLGDAHTQGMLYDLGDYPGLVLSEQEGNIVHGELYELQKKVSSQILFALDGYEECGPTDPRPHEYERKEITVTLSNGMLSRAWAYVLGKKPIGKPRIVDGNYTTWRRTGTMAMTNAQIEPV